MDDADSWLPILSEDSEDMLLNADFSRDLRLVIKEKDPSPKKKLLLKPDTSKKNRFHTSAYSYNDESDQEELLLFHNSCSSDENEEEEKVQTNLIFDHGSDGDSCQGCQEMICVCSSPNKSQCNNNTSNAANTNTAAAVLVCTTEPTVQYRTELTEVLIEGI